MYDNLTGDAQLFQPDFLLPAQLGYRARRVGLDPSHRLVVAVFEDAIEIVQKHFRSRDPKVKALFDETYDWFFSDDRDWPYAFLNVCDVLKLDAGYVRFGLLAWLDKHRQENRTGAKRASADSRLKQVA